MRMCSIKDCNEKHRRNGYCNKHAYQMRRWGKIRIRSKNDLNEIIIENNVCRMKLYNIDSEEIAETLFDLKYKKYIEKYKWHLTNTGHVHCTWYDKNNKQQSMLLHQAIVFLSGQEIPNGYEIDHEDLNSLNNLDNNLRICTRAQNQSNKNLLANNVSGFKGVSFDNTHKKWRAQISVNNKNMYLGDFEDPIEAVKAYNVAAIKYQGQFCRINEINLETQSC